MTDWTQWAGLAALVVWGLVHSLVISPWLFWNRTLSTANLVRLIDRLADAVDAAQNDHRVKRALGRLTARLGVGEPAGPGISPEKALKWAILQRILGPLLRQAAPDAPGYLPEAPGPAVSPKAGLLGRFRQ